MRGLGHEVGVQPVRQRYIKRIQKFRKLREDIFRPNPNRVMLKGEELGALGSESRLVVVPVIKSQRVRMQGSPTVFSDVRGDRA